MSASSIPSRNSTLPGASAIPETSLSNAHDRMEGQMRDRVSAQGLSTSRRWTRRSQKYIIESVNDNIWTLTAFLVGFLLVAINSVQFPTHCPVGRAMLYNYCSRLDPRRLAFDRECQATLSAGHPCTDTIFGRRTDALLQREFSLALNPQRMVAVDRLFSVAFFLTYLLNPRIMDAGRGVAPFTTPLACLCVIFEEKTLDGMLSTFARVLEHVLVLRVLTALFAWLSGGTEDKEGEDTRSIDRDEEKNVISEKE